MTSQEMFNVTKGLALAAAIFVGLYVAFGVFVAKKHNGPAIEYIYLYTTINGQLYEKEATAQDMSSGFVTFGDGTRVPWSAVKSKRLRVYPDELTNAVRNSR